MTLMLFVGLKVSYVDKRNMEHELLTSFSTFNQPNIPNDSNVICGTLPFLINIPNDSTVILHVGI